MKKSLLWFFLPTNSYIFISLPFSSKSSGSSSSLWKINWWRWIITVKCDCLPIYICESVIMTNCLKRKNLIWINCNFPHFAMAWARDFNVIYFHPTENMSPMLTVPCLVCISSWLPYNYFLYSREKETGKEKW